MNILFLLPLAFALFAIDAEAKNCRKGKPCGNTCIAMSRTCHIGSGSYSSAPSRPADPRGAVSAPTIPSMTPSPEARQGFRSVSTPVQRERLYVQKDTGFVMDEPSSSAFMVRKPIIGEQVTIYRRVDGWARISAIDTPVEWIRESDLGPSDPARERVASPTMMPITENGFIMDQPSIQARRVRQLRLEDVFTIYQTANGWARVSQQHEPPGWVLLEHLAP